MCLISTAPSSLSPHPVVSREHPALWLDTTVVIRRFPEAPPKTAL